MTVLFDRVGKEARLGRTAVFLQQGVHCAISLLLAKGIDPNKLGSGRGCGLRRDFLLGVGEGLAESGVGPLLTGVLLEAGVLRMIEKKWLCVSEAAFVCALRFLLLGEAERGLSSRKILGQGFLDSSAASRKRFCDRMLG